jgi:membrane-associated phospholipid phosphatase
MLAILTENKTLKMAYFIFASLAAFSRVYLSQHFLMDAMAGSIIGILTVIISIIIFGRFKNPWFERKINL